MPQINVIVTFFALILPLYILARGIPSKFRIEPVKVPSDLTGVAQFCCDIFLNDKEESERISTIKGIERQSIQRLVARQACMVVALDGCELVGYGEITLRSEVSMIESVCVAPLYRRQGVGNAIVKTLIELGTVIWKDMKTIQLNVEDDNPKAKRFYSSLNFTTIPGSQGFGSEMMTLGIAK